MTSTAPDPFWWSFGPFELDVRNGQLRRGDERIALRPKTLRVLTLLVQRAAEVLSRDEILTEVWPETAVQEAVLTGVVSELRRALGDSRRHPSFIETVHGRGFRFIAEVRSSYLPPARGIASDAPAPDAWPPERSPFVGRADEIARVSAAIDEIGAGQRRVLLLRGPAGIGKSRLLREAARLATQRGALVLSARADDVSQHSVFWIWIQLVRALAESRPDDLRAAAGAALAHIVAIVPSLEEQLGAAGMVPAAEPSVARACFFDAMITLLRNLAQRVPVVLLLDDLQRAAASSLALLRAVVEALPDERLLILIAYRNGESPQTPDLSSLIADWSRTIVARPLDLPGLSATATRELMLESHAPPLPAARLDRILANAEGNPYFVLEIAKSLRDGSGEGPLEGEIPANLRRLSRDRLRSLSPATRQLLWAGAIAGIEFHVRVAARVAGLDVRGCDHALIESRHARFLDPSEETGEWVHFHHDLARETILGEINALEATRLHYRVGEAIEEIIGTKNPSRLAHHYSLGAGFGGAERAIHFGLRAARLMLDQFANEEAHTSLEGTLALAEDTLPAGDERLLEILENLAEAKVRLSRFDEAEAAADRLLASAKTSGQRLWLARAAIVLARNYFPFHLRMDAKALRTLSEALAGLPAEDSLLRGHVTARLAVALLGSHGSEGRRIVLGRESVRIARAMGDVNDKLELLYQVLPAFWDNHHLDERQQLAAEMEQDARRVGNAHLLVPALGWQYLNLITLGKLGEAERRLDEFGVSASRTVLPGLQRYLLRFRWNFALLHGRLDEARQHIDELRRLPPHASGPQTYFEVMLADLALKREVGGLGDILPMMRGLASQFPALPLRAALPYLLLEAGETDEARAQLLALAAGDFADLPPFNEATCWSATVGGLADVCSDLGESDCAATLYDLLAPCAGQWIVFHFLVAVLGSVDRCLGRLAATLGAMERAAEHFERSLASCEREGAVTELARVKVDYARALEAQRIEPERARQLRDEALALADRHGLAAIPQRAARP